jgi:hypothetical protein
VRQAPFFRRAQRAYRRRTSWGSGPQLAPSSHAGKSATTPAGAPPVPASVESGPGDHTPKARSGTSGGGCPTRCNGRGTSSGGGAGHHGSSAGRHGGGLSSRGSNRGGCGSSRGSSAGGRGGRQHRHTTRARGGAEGGVREAPSSEPSGGPSPPPPGQGPAGTGGVGGGHPPGVGEAGGGAPLTLQLGAPPGGPHQDSLRPLRRGAHPARAGAQ